MNLGEKANYEQNNYVTTTWTHASKNIADFADKLGTAPTLKFAYDPVEGNFNKDTEVNVTSVISPKKDTHENHSVPKDTEILQYTTFNWKNNCNFNGCKLHKKDLKPDDLIPDTIDRPNFIVHLNTFNLKIVKEGWDALDPDQSYIFNVVGPEGSNINLKVMINSKDFENGMGSVLIKGVPVGDYTITEDVNWSWRYTPVNAEQVVGSGNAEGGTATATFVNTRPNKLWMDGNAYVDNQFAKAAG